MKLLLLTLSLLWINLHIVYNEEEIDSITIKQTLLILKPENISKNPEMDYLSEIITNAVISSLQSSGEFVITNLNINEDHLKQIYRTDFNDKPGLNQLIRTYQPDAVINGNYLAAESDIRIQLMVFNTKERKTVAVTDRSGKTGSDLLRCVDDAVSDLTGKTIRLFPQMVKDIEEKNKLMSSNSSSTDFKDKKFLSGILLTSIGSTLFLSGTGLLIYDLTGYGEYLRSVRTGYEQTRTGFENYQSVYGGFIAMFVISLNLITGGSAILITGIILLAQFALKYKKNISLDMDPDRGYNLCICFKLG
jgi:TolB-like protein